MANVSVDLVPAASTATTVACLLVFCMALLVPTDAFQCPSTAGGYTKLTDGDARARLAAARISVYSSGSCSDRSKKACTSLAGVNLSTIGAIIAFKGLTNCNVVVTGGTETGHEDGTFSHWNGYSWTSQQTNAFACTLTGRSPRWGSNMYEGNHGDITVLPDQLRRLFAPHKAPN